MRDGDRSTHLAERENTRHTHSRGQGRPLRLPEDHTRFQEPGIDDSARLAWLLILLRLSRSGSAYALRDDLVTGLRDLGIAVDSTRVSRWESGQHPVPARVLAGYESLLGLPDGSLVALGRGLARANVSHHARRESASHAPDPAGSQALLEHLIDRATSAAPGHSRGPALSGGEWLSLSTELTRYESVFLDTTTWRLLCARLLEEVARTAGCDQLRRYEACVTLVGHPGAQRHILRALGEWVTHPDVQLAEPVLSLLQEIDEAAAGELVIKLINSGSRLLSESAVRVAATKLARGHFNAAGLLSLEGVASSRMIRPDARPSMDTLDLFAHLPRAAQSRILHRLKDAQLKDRLESLSSTRLLIDAELAVAITRATTATAQALAPDGMTTPTDKMLRRLIGESLFHVNGGRRRLAAHLLAASPHASGVTEAYLGLASGQNEFVAVQAWQALGPIARRSHRLDVTAMALGETRAAPQASALSALGSAMGPLGNQESGQLVAMLTRTKDNGVRAAAMTALGLAGHDHLDSLRPVNPEVDRAASWWKRLGPALADQDASASAR